MIFADVKNLLSKSRFRSLRFATELSKRRRTGRRNSGTPISTAQACVTVEVESLEAKSLLTAITAQLAPSQDTTIYEEDSLASNGAGQFLVSGEGVRSLLRFDVASVVPSGATVLDVVLTLNLGETDGSAAQVGILPVTQAWGEAGSDAPGNEHSGAPAAPFDATWQYAFYDGSEWATPGGDLGSLSAEATVSGIGAYEWFSEGLISDVQAWVDNSTSNFGWAISTASEQLKSFVSKDGPGGILAPRLEVTYEPPPGPPLIVEGRLWNDANGDGLRSDPALTNLDLTLVGGNDFFDAFGGGEYWLRSNTDGRWYFLTENGQLTRWTGFSGQLVGEVVATLDPVYYLQPTLLLQSDLAPEPWLDGWTVELLNVDGEVVQTTVTAGRDLNGDGIIDPELEGGFYRFTADSDQEYSVRQVVPGAWRETIRVEFKSSTPTEKAVNSRGFYLRDSYFQNFGGLNEKWIFSDAEGWHFVTPEGRLVEWNGQAVNEENPLSGTLVALVGAAAWEDPTTLFDGDFESQQSSEDSQLVRIDFGSQATQTVRGRVWLDFFANGERDEIQLIPDYFALTPSETLGAGEEWFYDFNNDDWYVIDADGLPLFWGKNDTRDDEFDRPGTGGSLGEFIESEIEPWVNRRTVQLIDADGAVVATTESTSIDWDHNGELDFETERGWYVFEDVPLGEYTIRTVGDDDWRQTAPVIEQQSEVIQLSQSLGLALAADDFSNWGGLNERWVRGDDSQWFYILPNGEFYQWQTGTGVGEGDLQGNLISTLSSTYYAQLELLTNPESSLVTVSVTADQSPLELLFGNHQVLESILNQRG
ncbi:MAG: DNRLRE domain-containing protein [Fuerstiella sp.]